MNKIIVNSIISDQRELINEKLKNESIIDRVGFSSCERQLEYPNVLLISGLRRAGKSIFAHLLAGRYRYAYINFDDERLIGAGTEDLNTILECFYEIYGDFELILLDEIQNITGWELFVNRLREKYRIIITGSNANLLSSELATHLTGRYSVYSLYPMSFMEYLLYRSVSVEPQNLYSTRFKAQISALFSGYLYDGGIFENYKFGKEFLRNLFSSVIAKDVSMRYKIKYPHVLKELAILLVNGFTSKISHNNIAGILGVKSSHTIQDYTDYLERTYLFFSVGKYSFKLKNQLSAYKKIYVTDNGLISALNFEFSSNRGRYLENLVAIELMRRGAQENFEVYYWDDYHHECDFVIKKSRKITAAYQVCTGLTPKNESRELNGLLAALKEFNLKEGIVLTESNEYEIERDGFKIKVIPVWKWLVE